MALRQGVEVDASKTGGGIYKIGHTACYFINR